MPFSVGDRLGRFEILGALGAGGMGEVYRARDPQLQREVAIKVLPDEVSDDPARRRRFEQEARAAGGLNHPNIMAVFDIGVEGGASYIVSELLEGQTLAELMSLHAVTPRHAVEFICQIAGGLAAAHERGVIHRDIKPSNVFVTTDGRIKILDFGLAKFLGADQTGTTDTTTVDAEGRPTVMGSVMYMSPEQARGQRLDHRTDIFSLGAVFYELLAGFPPFRRATPGDTLRAILHENPAALPAGDPDIALLEPVVRHCLEKSPQERFQHVRDLIFDLQSRAQERPQAARHSPRSPTRSLKIAAALVSAALVGATGGAYLLTQLRPPSPDPAMYRVRPLTDIVGLEEYPAISPDGKMVAFTAVDGDNRHVFVRYLDEDPIDRITDDPVDHESPRWLPNGTALVYFSPAAPGEVQGAIYKIPVIRGARQRVMASLGAGDVSSDGRLACFRLENDRIQLVTSALDGSNTTVIAELGTQYYSYPRWSPDGQSIAFQAGDGFRWDVHVVRARAGSTPQRITSDAKVLKGLTWLADGSGVVYATSRASTFPYLPPLSLWQTTLEGRHLQLTTPEASYEQPDLHPGGLLSATRLRMRYEIREYPVDRVTHSVEGGREVIRQTGQVSTPTPSPSGDEVAYLSDTGGHTNVWVRPPTGPARQITDEDDPEVAIGVPAWSPDGQWIAYLSSEGNNGLEFGVWLVRPDGSGKRQVLSKGLSPTWSEDSRWIYYVERANAPIKRISIAGGAPEVVRTEPARNFIGVHGSTVYYVVDRALTDGRQQFEIHAAPIGGGPPRSILTLPIARIPQWQVVNPSLSPDGRRLATALTDGLTTNIWTIATADGRLQRVTDFGGRAIFITRRIAWSADGRSILAAIGEGDADIVLLDGLIKRPGS